MEEIIWRRGDRVSFPDDTEGEIENVYRTFLRSMGAYRDFLIIRSDDGVCEEWDSNDPSLTLIEGREDD